MKLTPYLGNRNFTDTPQSTVYQWSVDQLHWHVYGGCKDAQLSANAGEMDLWALLDTLRCPVLIQDDLGRQAWWGYVDAVEITSGGITYGVSLSELANSVVCIYSYVAVGTQDVGTRKATAAATDAVSIAYYGTKELAASLAGASDAQALGLRDTLLAQRKYPIATKSFGGGSAGASQATLSCRGWFDTLDWRYYANTGVTSQDTTAQIAAIVTASGQFLTATDIAATSGIASSEYRDGSLTALAEMTALLKSGTTNNRRLLATVDPNRRLSIAEEPAKTTNPLYSIDKNGVIYDNAGAVVPAHLIPVGVWSALSDVIPATVDLTHIADPSVLLIEEVVWSDGVAKIIPRDNPGYMDLGGIG